MTKGEDNFQLSNLQNGTRKKLFVEP